MMTEPVRSGHDRTVYERYSPVVRRLAMRVVRTLPSSVTVDDVLSAGWVGMSEALRRRSDGMSEEQFEAYASHRIRGAILDYLRMLDPMTRKLRGASRRVSDAIARLSIRLGRQPESEEVAAELGLDLEAYHQLLGDIGDANCARLEISDLDVSSGVDLSPEGEASRQELAGALANAIRGLPERQQTVLGLYYQDECTLKEIGHILGVTESRVCQIHTEAVHRLRAALDVAAPRRGGGRPA